MEEGERRPKRRCVQRKNAVPSAVHYVGYVEDEETPEMIMKKFEELERLMAGAPDAATRRDAVAAAHNTGAGSDEEAPGYVADAEQQADAAGPSSSGNPAADAAEHEQARENLLLEVFKRTSYFNVRSVLGAGTSGAHGCGAAGGDGGDHSSTDACSSGSDWCQRGFWSDDGGAGAAADERRAARRGQQQQRPRVERAVRSHSAARERHMRHQVLTQYNKDTNALIRRKIRPVQRDEVLQLRIPPAPIPLSWGRTVNPFDPTIVCSSFSAMSLSGPAGATAQAGDGGGQAAAAASAEQAAAPEPGGSTSAPGPSRRVASWPSEVPLQQRQPVGGTAADCGTAYYETEDVVQFVTTHLAFKRGFQAVLINSGWEPESGPGQPLPLDLDDGRLLERFRRLPLTRLCPSGFVFVWVCKQHLHPVTKQLHCWGYQYVENLTWVWTHPNNSIVREASPYARRSHLTLLIFRKEGEGKDIELKHQRKPDVLFDCVRSATARDWDVPPEVYNTIETMLPTGQGLFLELWAAQHGQRVARPGWTQVVKA